MKRSLVRCCTVLFFGLIFFGCGKSELKDPVYTEPIVMDWLREDTLVTVGEVKKVDGLEIGRVSIKRSRDGSLFSVLVIPVREIPLGSEVKISEVLYVHNWMAGRKNFFVVK